MGAPPFLRSDADEPLGLARWPLPAPERQPGVSVCDFEFTSRGDRVPGRLWLPPQRDAGRPVVLLGHDLGGSKSSAALEAGAEAWAQRGLAVAAIDLPLHGDRASAKLSQLLATALGEPARATGGAALLAREFFQQAVADLRRAFSALAQLPEIDALRAAYAGFGLGAGVGAAFCAADPRPLAAVFAQGGGVGAAALDPARRVGGFAPRPALFVNTTDDEVVSRESALAFFAGAGEPKEQLWFEGTHAQLPSAAREAMERFLTRHVGSA